MMETTRQLLERLESSLQASLGSVPEPTANDPMRRHRHGLRGGLTIAIEAIQRELKWLPAEEPKNDTDEG